MGLAAMEQTIKAFEISVKSMRFIGAGFLDLRLFWR
jgi:hypothetical protein